MLQQLESHVAEQQRFAANASHELRTPLAISRTLLDVARKDPTRDRGELIERLHAVNTRAIDLTEALLLLSRGDRGNFTRESVDLSLIAEEAAETLLPLAEQRRITLDVTGGAAGTSGSAELLLRMVTNLVQNAIVHNLPAGGAVTVHTEAHGDTSVLRVENTGRRLPPELVPTLTEPFQRGTERVRTEEHAGVGLGLAIVHSIVRAHDGTLDLVPRPAGGLLVTVRLPGTP
jgi:two-component system sensor histidine kinase VanS